MRREVRHFLQNLAPETKRVLRIHRQAEFVGNPKSFTDAEEEHAGLNMFCVYVARFEQVNCWSSCGPKCSCAARSGHVESC